MLLPVYAGDDPGHLARSIASVVSDQHLVPEQLVVVLDGPVGQDLIRVVDDAGQRFAGTTVVPLQHNIGLGQALDAGLDACSHDIVARQDADDISLPQRFAVQVPLIESGADLVGSGIIEFGVSESHLLARRTPPTGESSIVRYSRFHDPFNHPTVVYRRSAVQASGGYEHLPLLEDYWLFARMIQHGARVENVPEPLVLYRVGTGSYHRRGGRALLRSELDLQKRMRRAGFTSRAQYARNVLVRGGYRLVPEPVRRRAYRRVFTTEASIPGSPG